MEKSNYEKIVKACAKANSKLDKSWKKTTCGHIACNCEELGKFKLIEEFDEPTLADVLMVTNYSEIKDLVFYLGNDFNSLWVYKIDYQSDLDGHPWLFWDLSKPLKDQSPEVLSFIALLL